MTGLPSSCHFNVRSEVHANFKLLLGCICRNVAHPSTFISSLPLSSTKLSNPFFLFFGGFLLCYSHLYYLKAHIVEKKAEGFF